MYATRCTLWPQALSSLSYLYLALLSTYHIRFVFPPIRLPLPLFLTEMISRRRQATKDSDELRLIGIFMYMYMCSCICICICSHSCSYSCSYSCIYSCSCSPSCVSTIASKLFKEMSSICLSFGLIRGLERGHEDEGDRHQIMLSL